MRPEQLTTLANLTDALSRATSVEQVYTVSLDCLQDALGVERASILLFDADDVMSFVAWRGISDSYRRAVNGHTPWRPETENPEPVLVPDAEADPSLARYIDVFRAEGIRALGFFALTHRDRVIGKFMLYYAAPHEFTTEEVALAKTIAGQISFGVTRILAEQAIESERERLMAMVANVPGMVWETIGPPTEQKVSFVSDGILELTGYPAEEWERDPHFWERIIVERLGGDLERLVETSIRDGIPAIHHYKIRRRDGRIVWVEVRSAHKIINGTLVSRGVTMDITARKHAEQRNAFLTQASGVLSASLDYERTLAEVADLVVASLGDWCAIDVVEHGELSRIAVAHRDPETTEEFQRLRDELEMAVGRQVIENNAPVLMRGPTIAFGGLPCESAVVVVPVTAAGHAFGAISIAACNPAHRYDEEDMAVAAELGRRAGYAIEHARLYREAQAANRAKDEFLATLSHELRTPMTSALGWASLLRLADTPPETFQLAIETIERSIRAQAKLIDDIFDVSLIVTGKLKLQMAPVDLPRVIQAAIQTIQPSLSAKALRLEVVYDAGEKTLLGDASRIQQVIWNVLSNAVKFTPPGGTIRIEVRQSFDDRVQISIRDTGQGIPRQLLPFVFERFRQGDSSSTRSHSGLGLGLAIVKNIVELHGGSVTAESEGEGKGSVFTVSFPQSRQMHAGSGVSSGEVKDLALPGVVVLVVEDDDDTRIMITKALEQHGASVIAVGSAPAALEALQRQTPHVVVSDIAMPGEDGYSLLMKIRAGTVDSCRNVPAVAITAFARPEDRDRMRAAGFQEQLAKPVDALAMLRAVRSLVTYKNEQ